VFAGLRHPPKRFADLTEREILAVAISAEEEDSRIYMTFAEDLQERYPASAKVFEEMAEEEQGHRGRLLDVYQKRFGSHLPPIRREDVKGFLRRRPVWLTRNLPLDTIRKQAATMEYEARRFYQCAAMQATDVGIRKLLGDLAFAEKKHESLAASFAEALSDDGSLTGRGSPILRGGICGLMTTVGGLGHTMPYLVPDSWPNAFWIATGIAGVIVLIELWVIAWVRSRYMDTPFLQAVFQIVLGGLIVLGAGIAIGGA
jgi:rubrerythrin